MKPFLYRVAERFYREYGQAIDGMAFVFPNRRAGLFFQKYLAGIADKPLFSPHILTINDLFVQLSGKQAADRISLLFTLYRVYTRIGNSTETFDEFLYWGEMLLNDFDDVDKYMADARMLFSNVTDLREIETDFSFLSPNQIAAIRSFWSSFTPQSEVATRESFLAVWQILYRLYTGFKEELGKEGKGYEGMIFREVVDKAKGDEAWSLPWGKVVFVGLNALSVAEEQLLMELQKRNLADFYWDYESPKVKDPDNKASFFAGRNLKNFPSAFQLESEAEPEAKIEVIGIPSGIGQAKQVYHILDTLCRESHLADDEEEALRTAVVLPDEHLLIPVLNAIPEAIKRINVTMGYPLNGTPVASLMDYILVLQKDLRYMDRLPMFYFRDVLPVLNHHYVTSAYPAAAASLVKEITENNKVYISAASLDKAPLFGIIFSPVEDIALFPAYLIRILEELNKRVANPIEQEFIFHYFTTVNRMNDIMAEAGIEMMADTYFRLLRRMTETISIPFRGEPLSGLQVMGVLETRALDFDRLIILSMNEGVFPQKKAANSFIPYNLRRGFGLPTYEHQDSVWSYHFYRLIHRASSVSLLYDTRSGGLQTGEKSRFIHQLHYHYEVPLRNKLVVYNISSSKAPVINIGKSEEVKLRLAAFHKGGERSISASAINTYLDCPLKFYLLIVEGIREEDEVSETIESDVFGSILHKVMETLYNPLRGKLVTADLLLNIRKDKDLLTETIAKAFAEIFFKTGTARPLTGQNYLVGEMIRKYTVKVLERDSKLTPFRYLESECKMNDILRLSDGTDIQLKGFIDRVDEVRDTLRIIDYKSGKGTTVFSTPESLFDLTEKDRPKAVMQVFMYAWMYHRLPRGAGKPIQPGIYYMRTLFSNDFDASVYQKEGRNKHRVENVTDCLPDFEANMRSCLEEIFTSDAPFTQTPTGKACEYCQFKDICGK